MEFDYSYSKKGQLDHPQKYQKTPFEGKNFLLIYQNFREKSIRILKEKIEEEIDLNEILGRIEINKNKDSKFITRILLESILKENTHSKKNQKIINTFIKKFEIKKRIFSSYDKLFFENSLNYKEIINYILLSNICIIKYQKSKNLKFLNTVLKLNDIICSEIENIKENMELNLAIYCIKNEMDIILKTEKRFLIF
jgi:hypothetical protein